MVSNERMVGLCMQEVRAVQRMAAQAGRLYVAKRLGVSVGAVTAVILGGHVLPVVAERIRAGLKIAALTTAARR